MPIGNDKNNKILVIVGPTGSGKTAIGVELAKRFDGEIISADSRAIYKGMDIGTAKPTPEEQKDIPHYGLDLIFPDEKFNVFDFKKYALEKIKDIQKRGKTAIVVGGTGLYVDALIYDYQFSDNSKKYAEDREKMLNNYRVIGIKTDRDILRERLKKRIDQMFIDGIVEETKEIFAKYDHDLQALKSDIYPIVWQYYAGKIDLEEAKNKAFLKDWGLARRQITWFKRNPNIEWMNLDEVFALDKLF